jgi:hypothetical protein
MAVRPDAHQEPDFDLPMDEQPVADKWTVRRGNVALDLNAICRAFYDFDQSDDDIDLTGDDENENADEDAVEDTSGDD